MFAEGEQARYFEEARSVVLEALGGKRTFAFERMQFYGGIGQSMLAINTPYDGERATVGNGSMFGIPAASNPAITGPRGASAS